MPDVDGFEVIDRLKKDPKTEKIPIIIMTAKDLSEEQKEMLLNKVNSLILKKDLSQEFLLETICSVINNISCSQETINLI